MNELDKHLEGLRALLHSPPGADTWRALCLAIERWPADHEALALDYALPHLSAWPDALRRAPGHWALARALGQRCAGWPLARAWHVILEGGGRMRINVIRALRVQLQCGLKEAKDLLDAAPCCALPYADREAAQALYDELSMSGALVTLAPDGPALSAQRPTIFTERGGLQPEGLRAHRDALIARALRARSDFEGALQGIDLSDSALAHQDLSGANLSGKDLRKIRWHRVDLQRADLRGADLSGAIGYNLDLRGADLRGADLRGAHLHGGVLEGANFQGADLRGARVVMEDLAPDSLEGAITDGLVAARQQPERDPDD